MMMGTQDSPHVLAGLAAPGLARLPAHHHLICALNERICCMLSALTGVQREAARR